MSVVPSITDAAVNFARQLLTKASLDSMKDLLASLSKELGDVVNIVPDLKKEMDGHSYDEISCRLACLSDEQMLEQYARALFALMIEQSPTETHLTVARLLLMTELVETLETARGALAHETTITAGRLPIRIRPGPVSSQQRFDEFWVAGLRTLFVVKSDCIAISGGWYGPFDESQDILVDHGILLVDGVPPPRTSIPCNWEHWGLPKPNC